MSNQTVGDKTLFPDLPGGPLDRYRHNAKFDYRKLALTLDSEKRLRFRVSVQEFFDIRADKIMIETILLMLLFEKKTEFSVETSRSGPFICSK